MNKVKVCIKLRALFKHDTPYDISMVRVGQFDVIPRAGDWIAFGEHDTQVVEEVALHDGGGVEVWLGVDNGMAVTHVMGNTKVDLEGLQELKLDYIERGWTVSEEWERQAEAPVIR